MKQWYTFYSSEDEAVSLISELGKQLDTESLKLKQVGSEMQEQILKQAASETAFPSFFAYVPWMHHVLIIQRFKTIKEALFYIRRTIQEDWSRNVLDNSLRADFFHQRAQ